LPASAGTSQCLIINNATNGSFSSLAAAHGAASSGATLWVRGHCTGITEISKNLTLVGQQPNGFTPPTLDGKNLGSVLTVDSGTTLVLDSLTITGGSGTVEHNRFVSSGGGINNNGTVTLNSGSISGNAASVGGVISNGGTVTLNGGSITANTAVAGGGIYNFGTVTLNGGSISANTATGGGGGGIFNQGTLSGVLTMMSNNIPQDVCPAYNSYTSTGC
jgi:hypothetical protein